MPDHKPLRRACALAVAVSLVVTLAGCGDSSSPSGAAPAAQMATFTPPGTSTTTPTGNPTHTPSIAASGTSTPTLVPTAAATVALSCNDLAGKSFGSARVLAATTVAAAFGNPDYCRVRARIDPALNFEVRLPTNWNEKVVFIAGGGYDGYIPDPD